MAPKNAMLRPRIADYFASHEWAICVSTEPNKLASFLANQPRCGTVHISAFNKQGSSSSHCPAHGDPACACDPHSAERGQGMPALYLNLALYLLITPRHADNDAFYRATNCLRRVILASGRREFRYMLLGLAILHVK